MPEDGRSVERVGQTQYVPEHPRRMLASAIGAEDGQCAYIHAGIEQRCTNDAVAHTFYDFEGDRQRVEICEEHCPTDLDNEKPLVTDGGRPADSDDQCDRCGSSFRVELCEVHRGPVPGSDRMRLEAHLCYSCRQDTTHKVIG